jgi:hypothetical protein
VEALANISADELVEKLVEMTDDDTIDQYYETLGLNFQVGDVVEINDDPKEAKVIQKIPEKGRSAFGWNSTMAKCCGCTGVIWHITESGGIKVTLSSGYNHYWSALNLTKTDRNETWDEVEVGTKVQVVDGLNSVAKGWGKVQPGEVGEVMEVLDHKYEKDRVKVDFPSQEGWVGFRVELEVGLGTSLGKFLGRAALD